MSWVAVGVAVASAAVSAYNTSKTAKKQDRAAAEGISKQAEQQRLANARLNETLQFFEKSNSGDIREQLSDRYAKAVKLKQNQALAGLDTAGDSSEAYKDRAKSGSADTLARAGGFGDLFARIDAPGDQRVQEGYQRGDLGSDLGVFARNSSAIDYLTRLKAGGISRSPWLDIAAAGLSGAGKGIASKGTTGSVPAGTGAASVYNQNAGALLPGQDAFNYDPYRGTAGIFKKYGGA